MNDLTKGSPAKVMLRFAIPVALGNMFQLAYSIADTRVVGSVLGEAALAAVGATTSISTLFVGFLSGLTNGFSILVAREMGAGREQGVRRYGAGTLVLALITSLLLTVFSVAALPLILRLLHVPQDLIPAAVSYIRVILLGLVMTCLYNACAGILRAVGDTIAALLFLICSCVLNITLNLFFILGCSMGLAGVALSTVISQAAAAVLSLVYMMKKYPVFRFRPADLKITMADAGMLYGSGLSMAIMMSLVFFGTLSLQSAINTFGNETIVAHTAARKLTEFFMMPFSFLGATMTTYCSQNMGAGKIDRIRIGVKQAYVLACIWSVGMMVLSYTVTPQMVHLVTGSANEEIARTAGLYLKVNTVFYFVPAAISVLRNSLQGMGEHKIPVISSFIEMAGKVVIAFALTPILQYWGIIIAEPIIWILMVIPLVMRMRQLLWSGKHKAQTV